MRQKGYIALISVLIIGAAAVAIGTSLLIAGTDAQRETLALQQSIKARQAAYGCGEEALQVINNNSAFTGSNNLTIADTACSYTVTSTGASTRTIDATATSGNVVRKMRVYVTINSVSLSISSWQDVP